MASDLTPRQKQCLQFLVQYIFENLYQPSIREIGDAMKITSTNGVAEHLRALQRKGYIWLPTKSGSRSIGIEDKALYFVKCSDRLRARPIVIPKEAK